MTPLNVLDCPLSGVNLIEASAGTGKTWTIVALFVRLLLEGVAEGPTPDIQQILVVTYTKAATAELRNRLRQQLLKLEMALSGGTVEEPFLKVLLERFPVGPARVQAQQRIQAALTGFDAVAIYTIHGFCQRVLSEATFESGQCFNLALVSDDNVWLQQQADDFWRLNIIQNSALSRVLIMRGETPESWLREIRSFLARPYLQPVIPEKQDLTVAEQQLNIAWQKIYQNESGRIEALNLLQQTTSLNVRSYNSATVDGLKALLQDCLQQCEAPVLNAKMYALLEKFTPSRLNKGCKKNMAPPEHEFFEQIASWLAAWEAYYQAITHVLIDLKLAMLNWINHQQAQRRSQVRNFDDLLMEVKLALDDPECGLRLVAHIAGQFQAVLIDEFQDTDPTQYAIFRRCFIVQQRPVFLVGDPKQAIYSFRGADIFSYLDARQDAQHHYTLDTNRRSMPALVDTVNTLFHRPLPFLLADITYPPVYAQPQEGFAVNDNHAACCIQWLNSRDKALTVEAASQTSAECCVHEIVRLLTLTQQGRATLTQNNQSRPLQGGDIAILVATHRQGDLIRQTLAQYGVVSVSLTQDSLFASREAYEMLVLLRAWANPDNEVLLRRALVTELIGINAETLLVRMEDGSSWEAQLTLNHEDHRRWRDKGFMVAWLHAFARENVAQRLLPLPDGERRLTNLSHLAELLQQESTWLGIQPLLGWLEANIINPPQGEEAALRLESDAALVKIVTIHTAKGLQYPIVFCPFLWTGALECQGTAFWHYHQDRQAWLVAEGLADDTIRQQARSEILAEKLRLLYVALTRAQYRQYISWGWVRNMQTSALSWLLHGHKAKTLAELEALELTDTRLRQDIQTVLGEHNTQILQYEGEPAPLLPQHTHVFSYRAQPWNRLLKMPWSIASFTSLTQYQGRWQEAPDDSFQEEYAYPPDRAANARLCFPRGTKSGVCLHEIFETITFNAAEAEIEQTVIKTLAKHGFALDWMPAVLQMVLQTLSYELVPGVCLRRVTQWRVELEFTLPVQQLEAGRLIAVLCKPELGLADPLRQAAQQLDFSTIKGYLKGFIDLVFEANGKIYLVDYKSNDLGVDSTCYTQDALALAIAREHYYLQYLIYCVALRRYFIQRQVDFDARFGGVHYLYLRGLTQPGFGIWSDKPNQALLDALDQLLR